MWKIAKPNSDGRFACEVCALAGKEKVLSRHDKLKNHLNKVHGGVHKAAKRRFIDRMQIRANSSRGGDGSGERPIDDAQLVPNATDVACEVARILHATLKSRDAHNTDDSSPLLSAAELKHCETEDALVTRAGLSLYRDEGGCTFITYPFCCCGDRSGR